MTKNEVKARFEAEGISVAEWARVNGFNCFTVYRVLSGSVKCVRGEGHRIAVALGLKDEPVNPTFKPAVDAA